MALFTLLDRAYFECMLFPRRLALGLAVLALVASSCSQGFAQDVVRPRLPNGKRPNIVWITVDDMSPHFSCYGETTIRTPHVDALAARGTLFRRAFVTAPICSISRSALITGCYQTTLGCQNHRSGSVRFPIRLPEGMKTVPELLRSAGYHTSNVSRDDFQGGKEKVAIAKTDYNFVWDRGAFYDESSWTERKEGAPFFVQIQLHGGKHRGQAPGTNWPARVRATLGRETPPSTVTLPPMLPDDPVIRADWAQYLDTVRYTDWEVGRIVEKLRERGELDNTVIFFWTDHGISHVRHKQFLYEGGIHVPLVVAGPGVPRGETRSDLVEHIDIAAATLGLAGVERPERMQGRNFFASDWRPKAFVFAARDRADETVDRIRSARSERWKYIRNSFTNRPYLQPNRYKDDKAIVQVMRRLHAGGKLNEAQRLVMAESRPAEELYDLEVDPHELTNLASEPSRKATLETMRKVLDDWEERTGDRGRDLEPEEVYLNYVKDERPEGGRGNRNPIFDANVELMRRWAKERPMMR